MKVAVVGLGLFGKSLAVNLSRAGAEVIAIDSDLKLVYDIKDQVAHSVRLDATDEKELRGQGVHEVDVLVAAIGDNFEANQLLVMLAKKLGIPKVIARAPSLVHDRILKLVGADEVVMPEEESAEQVAKRLVQPSLKSYFELLEGYSVAEVDAPGLFHGKTLSNLDLRQRFHVNLIAIKRPDPSNAGKMSINALPLAADVIQKGDILAVAGKDKDIRALLNLAGG